jgi:hypothetical protein
MIISEQQLPASVDRISASDLSEDSAVFRIPGGVGCTLAGIAMISRRGRAVRPALLRAMIDTVIAAFPEARHVLLVAHSAAQPDTRVARYNKLWKSLSKRMRLPEGARSEDHARMVPGGLRWFGYIELHLPQPDEIIPVIDQESACHLITLLDGRGIDTVDELVQAGWDANPLLPPMAILQSLCQINAGLYRLVGQFDDREGGVIFMSRPAVIERL